MNTFENEKSQEYCSRVDEHRKRLFDNKFHPRKVKLQFPLMKITFEFETFERFKCIRFLIQLITYYLIL